VRLHPPSKTLHYQKETGRDLFSRLLFNHLNADTQNPVVAIHIVVAKLFR
jgi:hypothetical protein